MNNSQSSDASTVEHETTAKKRGGRRSSTAAAASNKSTNGGRKASIGGAKLPPPPATPQQPISAQTPSTRRRNQRSIVETPKQAQPPQPVAVQAQPQPLTASNNANTMLPPMPPRAHLLAKPAIGGGMLPPKPPRPSTIPIAARQRRNVQDEPVGPLKELPQAQKSTLAVVQPVPVQQQQQQQPEQVRKNILKYRKKLGLSIEFCCFDQNF